MLLGYRRRMRKTGTILKWIMITFFILLLSVALVIQTSFFKSFVSRKTATYLKKKIKTEFRIESIDYSIPNWVELNGLYAEDEAGKVLLKGKKIRLQLNMLGLLSGKYEISSILLDSIQLNLNRKPFQSNFNYQFITDAFVNKDTIKGKPIDLKLENIFIKNSIIAVDDAYSGLQLNAGITSFTGLVEKIDIEKLSFNIKEVYLNKSVVKIRMLEKHIPVGALSSIGPSFTLQKGFISKSSVFYDDSSLQITSASSIDSAAFTKLDYTVDRISFDSIQLQNSNIQVEKKASLFNSSASLDTNTKSSTAVAIKYLNISDNKINYKDAGRILPAEGFDPSNFKLNKLDAVIKDISYDSKGTQANIENITLKEAKGFLLDSLSAIVAVTADEYRLDKLFIKTPNSYIQGNTLILPATFTTTPTLNNEINIINTTISLKDVALLNPALVRKYRTQIGNNTTLFISLAGKGNAEHFYIQSLSANTNTNDIRLQANGILGNLNNLKKIKYDINIQDLVAVKRFLQPFIKLPGTTINLPPVLRLKGTVSGNTTNVNPDVVISSNYGIAILKGTVAGLDNNQNLTYNVRIAAKQLQTGKWINKDSLLGKLTGYITLKGRGIDYKKVSLASTINFSSFVVKQHEYNNIYLKTNASQGLYHINGDINDEALLMHLNTDIGFQKKYPSAKGIVNIGNADFTAMGFTADTLLLKTLVNFDLADLDPSTLKALIRLDSTTLVKGKDKIAIDSLVATGIRDSGLTKFLFASPLADANLSGNFTYNNLAVLADFYKEKYFTSNRKTNIDTISNNSFDLSILVKPHPMLLLLVPGLFFDKNITVTAKADNKNDSSFLLNAQAPLVVYNANRVVGFSAVVNGLQDSIKYIAAIDSASSGAIQLFASKLSGGYSNKMLSAAFVTNSESDKEQYAIGITGTKNNDMYQIALSDKLLLNFRNWEVNKSNLITVSKEGFNIQQLDISKQQEKISVASISNNTNAPIKITINQFALANITGILNKDSMLVDGKLNAAITIADFDKKIPTANGTIGLDSLVYQQIPVGNIFITAKTIDNSGVSIDGTLTGNDNKATVLATYNQENIAGKISLEPVTLQTVQAFSKGYLTRSKGNITGNIEINGAVTNPVWNGKLLFNDAITTLGEYGTQLKIDKQQINFTYPEITLDKFTIKDSLNQPLVIDGTVTQTMQDGFVTNLSVNTQHFTALDNTAAMNSSVYGKALVDAEVQITGPVSAPEISGAVSLKEKSDITVVRQQAIAGEKDRKGVIEFVDMDTISNTLVIPDVPATVVKKRSSHLLRYNLNVDISKEAKLSVIVDPLTRDELQVQGNAQLNAGLQPNGDIALTGAYNLSKGTYQLNYQFIKRKFELQEGSTILFSGDPLNAEADITAIYEINAVPFDLLGNELGGVSELESKLYKQKLPFQVILKIKGPVLLPQLSFNIKLKEKVAGVSANLSTTIDNKLLQLQGDASQMNKEVFALLVMGRFIGEQSKDFFASSGAGGGLQPRQVVKESVSRFLSEAVNQLAADLIKGVDVDVNLKTVDDYSTATQRTDLSVGLSKRLLDDRLSISVGKSFTLEGDDPLARGQNNDNVKFLPDVSTNYKLSKDGRYAIRLYRRNQYEAILDGYFTETGIAFTFSVNYDRFKDLFKKNISN